jgi:hypothetical protein
VIISFAAETAAPSLPSADDVSAKARPAFAHLQSSDVSRSKLADIKRPEPKSAPSEERNKETRGGIAQDQACAATPVPLVRRQDAVVRRRRDVSRVTPTLLE